MGTESKLRDESAFVNFSATDLRWTLDPLPGPEDDDPIDVWALSHADLLAYAYSLQDDLRAVRALAHAAVACVAMQTRQLQQKQRTIADLREQLRAA